AKRKAPARRKARPAARGANRRLALLAGLALASAVAAVVAVSALLPGEPDPSVPPVATETIPAPPPAAVAPARPAAPPESASPAVAPPSEVAAAPPRPLPPWRKNAVPADVRAGQPMIAIVIDDMGIDRARSARTVALPAPLTLAYLAYAGDLEAQTAAARTAGHELLVHVPMEPGTAATDPGPNALLTGLSDAELRRRIAWNLAQFDGYVGINNHMGSKATGDTSLMAPVMDELARRGLLFLDSRTAASTVAERTARATGIPALRRDVFLDHDPSPIAVRAALLDLEKVAEQQGFAIAIGHPKDATIAALAEWLPDVRSRGFAVVPVSAVARWVTGESPARM
ncbi:MAG: divergent polysaccharide deacetylase family protein, partial [Alphaproteobacteria bacterium]|nr:divergent polysaccharide deacetylase family protein [Alphaproteobacteria bacterium]